MGGRLGSEWVAAFGRNGWPAWLGISKRAGESLSRLADNPESGRVLPEFPDLPFREVVVSPYRFFYRVKDDGVWTVAAWHSAQIPGDPEDVGRD